MKLRKKVKPAAPGRRADKSSDTFQIRHCREINEFEACVRVEREVWKSADIDVVPIPLFVVASKTGGQVLGAFEGDRLVGFTMAIAGWRARRPFFHSHMTAVLDRYRDQGLGRRLKLFQREDALKRGIALIEWTFDPLVTKNAYFNFMRLGAIARRYIPNTYGITTSPLHASLPTDRLVAEWHLRSPRVTRALGESRQAKPTPQKAVRINIPDGIEELKIVDPERAAKIQAQVRTQFEKWFAKGYAATAVASVPGGTSYILERRSAK
jgi:predicted GNAT superfamily acetyltransferase